ncbi:MULTISPECIES: GlxA family transcriptional regulator [Pseudomonas]|jgi:transcriptional regulator GlxA family with amidase domain|uniref:GlxA family transcriptional regulator n=1 Tax=Pseudomonas rhodesiae TaxID=76760 RepID=A0A5C5NHT3_9PSED|nr:MULTISPECIES: GlxA family transcriptional regulator [Pseudomonas]MBB4814848.1 transcriptional regulator GlxA family with amidase domain [Pseudomonas rhodesiae]MBI6602937.1 GlxA family transcriptional regulator [Pseudomonas sp. S4_EA_1b]MBI6622869.1 GlxA family transcriptional regulator [Pseudomonas rhodesiae]NMY79482.1 GlxA family transcriptional regulator [Pseudomonas rhodesiae]NMZ16576.1 GlxA family transcriptional regulator [Pseudomonas rhodesiae]
MKTVAMALFPDFLLLDMAGPLEVFSIANRYLPPAQHYRILTLGTEPGPLRASNGVMVQADLLLEQALDAYDLLLVPGGPGAYNECHPALLPWLRAAVPRARRFGSICTGAFVLGYAGLLDGHRVTTHWHYTERLIKAFPKAIVETDRIYLQDGRLITSGGVTAGIDLALSVVAQDHGKQVAVEVAKVLLVVMKRQGGQAQFSPMTSAVAPQETPITRVQNHVLANLEQSFTVESMAALVDMSARHFARLFAKDVQMTPMAFLQGARIDRARHLLETTELPLKTVAFHAGFGSVRHMRFLFSEKLGLTPTQYRQQFS